jgi:hypothetical protein
MLSSVTNIVGIPLPCRGGLTWIYIGQKLVFFKSRASTLAPIASWYGKEPVVLAARYRLRSISGLQSG